MVHSGDCSHQYCDLSEHGVLTPRQMKSLNVEKSENDELSVDLWVVYCRTNPFFMGKNRRNPFWENDEFFFCGKTVYDPAQK